MYPGSVGWFRVGLPLVWQNVPDRWSVVPKGVVVSVGGVLGGTVFQFLLPPFAQTGFSFAGVF